VSDLAAQDVGSLRRWRLEVGLESNAQVAAGAATPGVTIPDNNPTGITSAIQIAQVGTAKKVKVSVDITHTFIGDLRVELMAPSGQSAVLHNLTGGSQDNLIVTFDSTSSPQLSPLVNQSIQGTWLLRVVDLAAQDVGKLNRWSIELTF
jgi:subtilisin-like proprotein convertase family protein